MTMFGEWGISQNIFMLPQEILTAIAFDLSNMLRVSLLILHLSVYPLNLLIGSMATSCQYIGNVLFSFFLSFFLSFCSFFIFIKCVTLPSIH